MSSKCPFLEEMERQVRLNEARYDDDVSTPFAGGADPLSVARTVFDQDGDMPNSANLSTLFTTWGQFLDHDIVLTPESEDAGTLAVSGMPHDIHRSEFELDEDGARVPVNAVTWQIDGSNVYGSTEDRAALLRAFEGGKLSVTEDASSARDLLPQASEDAVMAGDITSANPVYLAGDIRANENPNLLSMHTLFVREHNYWAERLAERHPHWDDEQLYDGARQIVEYEMQKITYEEWLPHLIGDAVDDDASHDPDADGQMSVEFSTAAFRLGHTLVSDQIDSMDDAGADDGSAGLMDSFFNHTGVQANGIESLIRGQLANTAQEVDAQVVDALNFFLETPDGVSGFSLPALNMARGLDHGLQSYVDTRAALLGDIDPSTLAPENFSIFTSDPDTQARLAAAFDDVFQVDLWTGGLAEDPVPGTQIGPLFTAIVADQFDRTRAADETFGHLDPALGAEIIAEVEASGFADIIVRNTDVDMVQEDVFVAVERDVEAADAPDTSDAADDVTLSAVAITDSVETGKGADTVLIEGGTDIDGEVRTGAGADRIIQTSGNVRGDIHAGSGDDHVVIAGSGEVQGDMRGGTGNDTIALMDMAQVGGDVLGGAGDDFLWMDGRASVNGGVDTGAGGDTISIGSRASVQGTVDAGAGNDALRLVAGAAIGHLDGGSGLDRLTVEGLHRIDWDGGSSASGSGRIVYLNADGSETGHSVTFENIEGVTCFTPGTRIIAQAGKVDIASLKVGDLVWTLDRGLQPVRWIGRSTVPAEGALAPICITRDTLGNGRDLWVSPQHRMLLADWRSQIYCAEDAVLAPAKGLVNNGTIRSVPGGLVTYIHIAFDAHEIVFAEGIASESLHTGPEALRTMDPATRAELLELFPELAEQSAAIKTARPVVSVRETRAMMGRL
ncbi:peroxidase family protein [uncultured Tateyamaria sp.]|uniref:peroxidase family protein n=1 Tax=uncultured Tateyamaria sp. TaxID=455651 RepID=UPI00262D3EE8|nr:peroxidase family protein [uncultured Tateyamaria sp.]